MTTFALSLANIATPKTRFDVHPVLRIFIALVAITMTALCTYAMAGVIGGFAAEHPNLSALPIKLHLMAVLPAIPLGGYLLIAPKGTAMHKQLGKVWVALMVATAITAVFIRPGGDFSWIHIFVPVTLHGAWKIFATARRGDIAGHKKHLVTFYLLALTVPGIAAFAIPGRVMNVLTFGW